ncbi:hypothetical protein AB0O90_00250 [Microbacterium testaceum]|uniref:hypothetical protein n=1 Tax=Microbacterium testaceum TaxID=2033 RepID=UPI0034445E2A
MSPSNTRILALSGTAIALGALAGCSGGEAEQPSATSAVPSPSLTTTAPPTPDPWAGYFDDEVADAEVGEYLWQSWGTFGDSGQVAPHRSENRTVQPGAYTVTLECAGPEMMTGRIATSAGTSVIDPLSVSCMAATPVPVDLPEKGLLVDLDSAGAAGAFLIRVAAAE